MKPAECPQIAVSRVSPATAEPEDAEEDVISAVVSGDSGSAAALYDMLEPAITSALHQVLGRRDDPERDDIVQATLERVVTSLLRGSFSRRCSLRTWSGVIATRVAIDVLRKRRRERRIFEQANETTAEIPVLAERGTERKVDAARTLQRLREALSRIHPAKAEAVLLFDVMGHDVKEVARLTGVSKSAAQTRVVRGRKELKRILGEMEK